MAQPALLVFDLDGTLIDSSLDLCLSVNAMLRNLGREALPASVIASFIGDGAAALVRRALEAPQPPPAEPDRSQISEAEFRAAYDFFIRYYREHKLDNTLMYSGAMESLRSIRERAPDTLMAVLTNKPVRPSREICRDLGMSEFFFQIYGGDSLPTKKPSPEGLLALIAEANTLLQQRPAPGRASSGPLQAAEVIMIGDSAVDVATARSAGVRSLGCTFGLAPDSLAKTPPDILVHEASQWPAALGF